jgi:hypothetical protein
MIKKYKEFIKRLNKGQATILGRAVLFLFVPLAIITWSILSLKVFNLPIPEVWYSSHSTGEYIGTAIIVLVSLTILWGVLGGLLALFTGIVSFIVYGDFELMSCNRLWYITIQGTFVTVYLILSLIGPVFYIFKLLWYFIGTDWRTREEAQHG